MEQEEGKQEMKGWRAIVLGGTGATGKVYVFSRLCVRAT
jgi:hypothetical protein